MTRLHLDLISASDARTLPGLFARRCERSPGADAYREYDEDADAWRAFTWAGMQALAGRWRHALSGLGLAPGERVAVLLRNCTDWVCFDIAAQDLGLIVVPLYTTDSPGNLAHILADSGAKVLLLQRAQQWSRLLALRGQFPDLAHVLCLRGPAPVPQPGISLQAVEPLLARSQERFENRARDPDAIATLVYTSGTTGPPKGVMLSHANILWNVEAVLALVPSYRDDLYLSFLPLSHAFERTCGYYLPMMSGGTVAFARSVQQLGEDLRRVRPTVLISVPRVYERAHARIQQQLARKRRFAQKLVRLTADLGWRQFEAGQGRDKPLDLLRRLQWLALRRMVARPILERLGGRLRVCVSGGAAFPHDLAHWFIGIGAPLVQGYGLSEASPVVTAIPAGDNRPASVGIPLPGVELRLAPDGEVLVRSPGVMRGYWGRPDETRRAIDDQGWLHTGDLGRLDQGHLYITGRTKEILVLSSAEKVTPTDLEMAIAADPLFEQVMVVGEGRPYLAALVVVNAEAWVELCRRLGLNAEDPAALESAPALAAALDRIAARLERFASYARVRRVWLSTQPWTIEAGLITPTLKLKREAIARRLAGPIAAMYQADRPQR